MSCEKSYNPTPFFSFSLLKAFGPPEASGPPESWSTASAPPEGSPVVSRPFGARFAVRHGHPGRGDGRLPPPRVSR